VAVNDPIDMVYRFTDGPFEDSDILGTYIFPPPAIAFPDGMYTYTAWIPGDVPTVYYQWRRAVAG
jgi:hypothetical protein